MADDQRVYSDEEFALILRSAADMASRPDHPASAARGLTLAEMKSAAAQAGLDPALVERAARMLAPKTAASPFERLVGGPLQHEHEARFPVKLDDEAAAMLLSAIRINATPYHSPNPGHSSALGVRWDSSGEGDVLQVLARPVEDGTSVSIVISRRGTFVLVGIVSGIAIFMSFIAGIGFGEISPFLGAGALGTGVLGTIAAARRFWSSSTRKIRDRMGTLMESIGQTLDQSGKDKGHQ